MPGELFDFFFSCKDPLSLFGRDTLQHIVSQHLDREQTADIEVNTKYDI